MSLRIVLSGGHSKATELKELEEILQGVVDTDLLQGRQRTKLFSRKNRLSFLGNQLVDNFEDLRRHLGDKTTLTSRDLIRTQSMMTISPNICIDWKETLF